MSKMKAMTSALQILPIILAALLLTACRSGPLVASTTVPADVFDAMMIGYETNGVPDLIRLDAGVYLTRGSSAWKLATNDTLVGAGVDKTVIRRMDAAARFVVNARMPGRVAPGRIADLTIDANAALGGKVAPCGIVAYQWSSSLIERAKVVGLGSHNPDMESFGILLSDCTNSFIRQCVVDKNVAGYVTAFCVVGKKVGILGCSATMSWEAGRKGNLEHLAAFATAGTGKGGSVDVLIANNTATGARYGVYSDFGSTVTGLTITNNVFKLRNYGSEPARDVRLNSPVVYTKVRKSNNRLTLLP